MKRFLVGAVLAGASAIASGQFTPIVNINSRYIVESIQLSGNDAFTLSKTLNEEIQNLVGGNFDPNTLDGLTLRIKKELHAKSVSYRISRGNQPEQVKVNFEITRRSVELDVNVPKFLYSTALGWSGVVEGVARSGANSLTFHLLSDDDELVERETGIALRYENKKLGSDRLGLSFLFESYHEGWSHSTQAAEQARLAGAPEEPNDALGPYRTRQNFQPMFSIALAKPLTLSAGMSFERFQEQFPAARTESSGAVVNTLRYHRLLEDSDGQRETLDAGYSLRAATNLLGSDYAYARHHFDASYTMSRGASTMLMSFTGGFITGRAPLFERYVLGNSTTLRGWNKYDLDPLGGSRLAHGTVEFHYGYFQVFCDAGAIWDRGGDGSPHTSAGVGLRKDGFSVVLAVPIKDGRVEPVLIAGMNF